ncbi:MAG: hypothetical protein JWQ71_596, partial [Pedosphaera sp.]|nr:hypothetical protein [Pedosphaera sp.]
MNSSTHLKSFMKLAPAAAFAALLIVNPRANAQQPLSQQPKPADQPPSSYLFPLVVEPFDVVRARDKEAKSRVMAEHQKLLDERYDLRRHVDENVHMTRGKPIPVGPTAKLKEGVTWEQLGRMSPDEMREKGVFPYLPLPHIEQAVGGMVFPQIEIKALPRLERFDMDFDLPEWFLPEFPPAMFLTTRKDLGDVSRGQLITLTNFFGLFNGILNPKQLEGLRLLLTQFPQQ